MEIWIRKVTMAWLPRGFDAIPSDLAFFFFLP
jgi:hypothetical protein